MAKAQTTYVVTHDGVGPWTRGEVLTADHLKGHDVDRLLALGAIAPEQSDDAKDAQATATAGVLPLHEENPTPDLLRIDQPTLPEVGVTPPASAPAEVKEATDDLTNAARVASRK